MSSRFGPRAAGTDGNDYTHRQKIANTIKLSVQYKFYLKCLFAIHFLVLLAMWVKVGSEFLRREFGVRSPFFEKLDLPAAYPWEYVWCLSFLPIIFGIFSFPHNKAKYLRIEYYGQFIFGILPCAVGIGSQMPELFDYVFNMDSSTTPTFKGNFPMVILWYIFFLISFQIHIFALYFSYHLLASWHRDPKKD